MVFMPSQSYSGGVFVNPDMGNIAKELQFLTEQKNLSKRVNFVPGNI